MTEINKKYDTQTKTQKTALTFHQFPPRLGTRARNGKCQFVDRHAVSDGQRVYALVGGLAGEKLPQEHAVAPHVARLREGGVLDDFRCHPGVCSGLGHPRRLVDLPR